MARDYGYEWEVSVYAYLKVAMAKRKDKEEIEEESFDATCRLFDHESDVTVIDNEVTEIHQDDKYFTVADVVAKRLPAGVSYVESNYYDTEKGEKAIDWDVA